MVFRSSFKSSVTVCSLLVCGIFLGYKLGAGSRSHSSSVSGLVFGIRSNDNEREQQLDDARTATAGLVASEITRLTNVSTCWRLWKKGTSAWFDERFEVDLLPVWTKDNMKLPEETEKWWMSLQSNKDKDYVTALREALEVIPSPDRFRTRNLSSCLRCAVVGNSGNLRNSGYGKLIDSNDVIIRINEAMIRGFEQDVGKRETHRMMYPENFRDIPASSTFILLDFKVLDVKWITSALTTGKINKTYAPVRRKIRVPPSKVLLYNPSLMWHVHRYWIDRKGRYPSSGTLAVFFALQHCDEVSVFGLGANQKGYWDHYWQSDDGARNSAFLRTHVHDAEHEFKIIKRLAEEKILRLYMGVR